jgi:hypothetical protein
VRNYSAPTAPSRRVFRRRGLRTPDGTLYFGGFNGITAFAVGVRENSVAPTVAITDFQIFNKSLKPGQGEHGDVLKTAIEHTAALTLLEAIPYSRWSSRPALRRAAAQPLCLPVAGL